LNSKAKVYCVVTKSKALLFPLWLSFLITSALPQSALTSFVDSSQGQHVVYLGTNQHVWQILWNGTSFAAGDLTSASGGPVAAPGSALTSFVDSSRGQHVVYLGTNQHIWQILWNGRSFAAGDLTSASGGPVVAPGSALTSFVDSSLGQHVVYLGTNQHVWQILWNGTSFAAGDLTSASDGPLAVLFYTVSGQVLAGGAGYPGVTVSLSGATGAGTSVSLSMPTNSNGNYSFYVPGGGTYVITPSFSGLVFSPTSGSFSNLGSNTNQNFTATPISSTKEYIYLNGKVVAIENPM
jgi:hypothetical protein